MNRQIISGSLKKAPTSRSTIGIDLNNIISTLNPAFLCGVFCFCISRNNSTNSRAEVQNNWHNMKVNPRHILLRWKKGIVHTLLALLLLTIAACDFDIPEKQSVTFSIYDLTGRKIFERLILPGFGGRQRVVWNGSNDSGKLSPSGMYLYKFSTNTSITTGKITYLK